LTDKKDIEFEDVIAYVNDMGSEDHLSMFYPEERHEEFIELQSVFDEALVRFKGTVKKWADESYKEGQTLEEIILLLKSGVKSPAVFLQQVETLTATKNKEVKS